MVTREDCGLRLVPSGSEFGGAEEVVIARRIQLQIANAFVVDQNVVEIPKIDRGQFAGKDALHLGIDRLANRRGDLAAGLVDERVYFWV